MYTYFLLHNVKSTKHAHSRGNFGDKDRLAVQNTATVAHSNGTLIESEVLSNAIHVLF